MFDGNNLLLEGTTGRHESDTVFPGFGGHIHHGRWQLAFIDQVRVKHGHAAAGGNAGPGTVGGAVGFAYLVQGCLWQAGQHVTFGQGGHGRAFFRVEHVGGRALAFFNDLVGQLDAVAGTDIYLDSGGLGEGIDNRLGGFFMLAAVQGQGLHLGRVSQVQGRHAEHQATTDQQAVAQKSTTIEFRHGKDLRRTCAQHSTNENDYLWWECKKPVKSPRE